MWRRALAVVLAAGTLGLPGDPAVAVRRPAAAVGTVSSRALAPGVTRVPLPAGAVLAGVTWPGAATPELSLRVLSPAGWTAWSPLEPDAAADASSAEASRVRPGTEPAWLPRDAVAVEVRSSAPARLEIVVPGSGSPSARAATVRHPRLGDVVTRAGWGADERLRRGKPSYASRVDAVVLHHTVTPNGYTEAEAAAYVRSVYAYHTRSRGYDDIGYNLVVDRFGRVYEGRAGGIGRAVSAAHTAGFNTRTLGVALLGNFDVTPVPAAAASRVDGITAWAGDRWRFDPRAAVTLVSAGGGKHRKGDRVGVRRLVGHRDLGATACPGRHAYAGLPAHRAGAWRRMAAIIGEVVVTGSPVRAPAPLRLAARLDHAAAWRVRLEGPLAADIALAGVVTEATGAGTSIALAWDGRLGGVPAPPGRYRFTVEADDGVHGPSDPVTGFVEVAPPA